ncbi:MAG TPA: cadherin repeat domain-containing protein, partial [Pirellulales bacterium]|nr:cadherin repeat domain-containing protein [Pirellulales bacterium]
MSQNFNFDKSPKRAVKPIARRRKRTSAWPIVAVLLVVGLAAGGGGLWYVLRKSLVLAPLAARDVPEMTPLDITVKPKVQGISADKLRYSLEGAPAGATIDARSGRLRWQPTEEQGGKSYQLKVRVAVEGNAGLKAEQPLTITVKETNQLPTIAAIADASVQGSGDLTVHPTASDADVPKQTISFALLKNAPAGSKIDPKTGEFTWSS